MHQEVSGPPNLAMIQDSFNCILFVLSIDRRWIKRYPAWEQHWVIVMGKFEASGIDFGVGEEFRWQLKSIIQGSWFNLRYLEWSDIARIKLGAPSFLIDP